MVQIANEYASKKFIEQTEQLEAEQKQTFLMTVYFAVVPLVIINLSLAAFILIKHCNCFKPKRKMSEEATSMTTDVEASVSDFSQGNQSDIQSQVSQGNQSDIRGFSQNIRFASDDVQSTIVGTAMFTNRDDDIHTSYSV